MEGEFKTRHDARRRLRGVMRQNQQTSGVGNGRVDFGASRTLGRRPNDSPAASTTIQGATSCSGIWR